MLLLRMGRASALNHTMGANSRTGRRITDIVEEVRFLHRLIAGLFDELWWAAIEADRAAAREIYQRLRAAIVRLYRISEQISEIQEGIDPAWSIICWTGQVQELPAGLRRGREHAAPFDSTDEAIDWWVAVRRRELEDEWRRTNAMLEEMEASPLFQDCVRGSAPHELACSLRHRRAGLERRCLTIENLLEQRNRPSAIYVDGEEGNDNGEWEEESESEYAGHQDATPLAP